jgi:hypothetical protein
MEESKMSPYAGEVLVSEIMPIITAIVPQVVRPVGSETFDEVVQDTVATAAKFVESCERRGRKIIPNSIAYYAVQQAKHGRRSYSASRMDALCPSAQLDQTVIVDSMDEVVLDPASDELTLHDLLSSRDEDPSQTAAREIDWAELLVNLDARDIAVLQCTVNGDRLDALALKFGVSSARLSQLKREIGGQVKERWGDDALENAMRVPAWNGNVNAAREHQACQHDRALEARR